MVCVWRLVDMAVTKSANVNVRIQENIKQQAEQILETIGVPMATAIDMFYRQIILNKGILFSLTIPKSLPAQDDMDEKTFNALMTKGYDQAALGDSYPIDDVFEELER
ncbi:type II toxin-antitoxin system antitoxin, RelB/DinJ family [Gardnerella vaginalis]|nr:type II toxin-antitoxin system RelB/DinJ family antitoxin [Gardnerella vaginalis]PKZ47648.1 type II toxin-antitoxin system antitoxin, RelB/DinJ family [Gardnerella vaginalis]